MASHALLTALRAKRPAFGAWLTLPGIFTARAVAHASPHISWVCIDCEHGLIPLHTGAAEVIQAVSSLPPQLSGAQVTATVPSALVRIPATGASTSVGWQIKYALDAGARGVILPMIGTPEKAQEIVSDCRFPPQGRRGFGNPFTHNTWGFSTATEYLRAANDSVIVLVQIETREALENAEVIAKVDGVDVLFIGPFDLSLSLGYPTPSPDPHPEVEKAIQRIKSAAHNAGKSVAIFCTSGEQAAKRAEEGFDMINVTSDNIVLVDGISKSFAAAVNKT